MNEPITDDPNTSGRKFCHRTLRVSVRKADAKDWLCALMYIALVAIIACVTSACGSSTTPTPTATSTSTATTWPSPTPSHTHTPTNTPAPTTTPTVPAYTSTPTACSASQQLTSIPASRVLEISSDELAHMLSAKLARYGVPLKNICAHIAPTGISISAQIPLGGSNATSITITLTARAENGEVAFTVTDTETGETDDQSVESLVAAALAGMQDNPGWATLTLTQGRALCVEMAEDWLRVALLPSTPTPTPFPSLTLSDGTILYEGLNLGDSSRPVFALGSTATLGLEDLEFLISASGANLDTGMKISELWSVVVDQIEVHAMDVIDSRCREATLVYTTRGGRTLVGIARPNSTAFPPIIRLVQPLLGEFNSVLESLGFTLTPIADIDHDKEGCSYYAHLDAGLPLDGLVARRFISAGLMEEDYGCEVDSASRLSTNASLFLNTAFPKGPRSSLLFSNPVAKARFYADFCVVPPNGQSALNYLDTQVVGHFTQTGVRFAARREVSADGHVIVIHEGEFGSRKLSLYLLPKGFREYDCDCLLVQIEAASP